MRRRAFFAAGGATVAGAAAWRFWPAAQAPAHHPPTMTEVEFEAIRGAVKPSPGEDPFGDIPWQTSLWDARELAAKVGKPILLWEMDGHPLGCG